MLAAPTYRGFGSLRFLAVALFFAVAGAAVVFADNVQNDIVVGGTDTFTSGGSTTVSYRITANNGDGETGCNASATSPATVNILAPANVTATPSSHTFTACGVPQSVVFTGTIPGDYVIPVSVADGGVGTYNTNPARFTLHVLDAGPRVFSNAPLNGATGVALNANIDITFSEAVNVTGAWFTIACASSGAHTTAASGGPTTFTLNPDTNFADNEACTVTVVATQVSDQDANDPPDNMTANHLFTFTTVAAPADTTAPSGSIVINDGATWTNHATGAVTVDLAATDAVGVVNYRLASTQAGLAGASPVAVGPTTSFTLNDVAFTLAGPEGPNEVWVRYCDAVPNCSDASDTIGWDKTPPSIVDLGPTSAPNGAGWYNTNVTNRFSASDSGSGLGTTCDAAYSEAGDTQSKTTTGEGIALTVSSDACTDVAGNAAPAISSAAFKVDKIAPTITKESATPAANANGWNNTDVTVVFKAVDALSTPDSACETAFSGAGGTQSKVVTGEGAALTVSSDSCTDEAGNTAAAISSGTIKIDRTAPLVSCVAPLTTPWYNADVSVSCTATDALSGLAPASDAGFTLATSGEGSALMTPSKTVSDQAGNAAPQVGPYGPYKVDKTAPVVGVTGVTATQYIKGSVPVAGCSTTDALSGVKTAATLTMGGTNVNGVGTFIATCSGAVDNADNVGNTASVTYTVIYAFAGFFQPIDMGDVLNRVKAGSAIPVKFSLGGNQGLNILQAGSPSSGVIPCDLSDPVDEIESTVNAGGSSLTYDATANQYVYVWKTDKAWAGTCRQLVVVLNDGTAHTANFQLTK